MNGLKKTIMGHYYAKDVDKLILETISDYEACLKDQKQRIIELRAENRRLSAVAEQLSINAHYAVDVMRQAQLAAKLIKEQAELEAMQLVTEAENICRQLRADSESCQRRLLRIKQASELVYLSACKAAGTESIADDTPERAAAPAVYRLGSMQ